MDTLKQACSYYNMTPWVGLLRAIEVKQFMKFRDLCVPPILDLGCGDGFIAKLAFGCPLDVGIDNDYLALQKAFCLGSYRVLINTDARHLPFKDGTFRTVYSNGAMEHMDDLNSVLSEIARVLMPYGVLVTLVPSHKFMKPIGKVGKFLGPGVWDIYNRLHNHINLLSPQEWRSRMSAHGFVIQSIMAYGKAEIAEFVSNQDMFSKLHLVVSWPFFQFRHDGNLGRVISRLNNASSQRLSGMFGREHENDSEYEGYWLFIIAFRNSGSA
jgi:SAM-dependent methyltransferase